MRKWFRLLAGMVFLLGVGAGRSAARAADKPIYEKLKDVRPLKKGDLAPGGKLLTIDGKEIDLKTLISQKPTILIFYRGGWCPYCSRQLQELAELEPSFEEMGFQILAISPDMPHRLEVSLKRDELNYTLLSDQTLELTRRFGLVYRLDNMSRSIFAVEKATGNSLHLLPVPAAFVLDTQGVIRFVYYNPDFTVRVNTEDLMTAAKGVTEGKH